MFTGNLECSDRDISANGCGEEFLYDLGLLLNDVKVYQAESPETVKLPRLSPVEKEFVKEEIMKRSKL